MAKKVRLEGYVGDELTPAAVSAIFDGLNGEDVEADLYSYGGFIYPGVEIHNRIRAYEGKKTVTIGAIVASAATYIALAFDVVRVHEYSGWMIHNAQSVMIGDSRDMAKEAEELEKFNKLIAGFYARKTGKSNDEIRKLMDKESTLYGNEIVDFGFADELITDGDGERVAQESIKAAIKAHNSKMFTYYVQLSKAGWAGAEAGRQAALNTGKTLGDSGDKTKGEPMDKKELLQKLKALKANGEITLLEIAESLGLKNQVMTDDARNALAVVARMNKNGVDDIEAEFKKLKDIADRGKKAERENLLTQHFGPEKNIDDSVNALRQNAARLYDSGMDIKAINEDPVTKQLKAAQADFRNLEIRETDFSGDDSPNSQPKTVKY